MSGLETAGPLTRKRRMGSDVAGVVRVSTRLKSKGRTTNREALLQALLKSLVTKKRWTMFSQDMDYSTLPSVTTTKAVNSSTVRCYGYKLSYYLLYSKELLTASSPLLAESFLRDNNSDTILFRHRVERRCTNVTNANLYFHVKMCTAKHDLWDNCQPDQLWQRDLDADYAEDNTGDAVGDKSAIENVGVWDVGKKGSHFQSMWSAGPWVTYTVRPGKEMVFNVDSDICYSPRELAAVLNPLLHSAPLTEVIHFKKGQNVALVKVVGERVLNQVALRAHAESNNEGLNGTAYGTSYGALVEYLMTQTSTLDGTLYPGFLPGVTKHMSEVNTANGQIGYYPPVDAATLAGTGVIFNETQGGWIGYQHVTNTSWGAEAEADAVQMADQGVEIDPAVGIGEALMESV